MMSLSVLWSPLSSAQEILDKSDFEMSLDRDQARACLNCTKKLDACEQAIGELVENQCGPVGFWQRPEGDIAKVLLGAAMGAITAKIIWK